MSATLDVAIGAWRARVSEIPRGTPPATASRSAIPLMVPPANLSNASLQFASIFVAALGKIGDGDLSLHC